MEIGTGGFRDLLELKLVALLVIMQGGGTIVNASAGDTLSTYPGSAADTSSKASLNMLSRVACFEPANVGIAVSLMQPSMTGTEFCGAVRGGADAARTQATEVTSYMHAPHQVSETILGLLHSGDAEADLVLKAYGGSLKDYGAL